MNKPEMLSADELLEEDIVINTHIMMYFRGALSEHGKEVLLQSLMRAHAPATTKKVGGLKARGDARYV